LHVFGSDPVTKALEAMSKHSISGVPVVDENGCFQGIFSDAGLVPAAAGAHFPLVNRMRCFARQNEGEMWVLTQMS
jgi:CBS domain-containing protein